MLSFRSALVELVLVALIAAAILYGGIFILESFIIRPVPHGPSILVTSFGANEVSSSCSDGTGSKTVRVSLELQLNGETGATYQMSVAFTQDDTVIARKELLAKSDEVASVSADVQTDCLPHEYDWKRESGPTRVG